MTTSTPTTAAVTPAAGPTMAAAGQDKAEISAATARGLAEDMAERIIARTDGVPLFAEELTRLVLDGQGDARQIPETLLDSLAARLDRMGRAKDVAQLGSVLGREFSYPLLRAVSSAPEEELRNVMLFLGDHLCP